MSPVDHQPGAVSPSPGRPDETAAERADRNFDDLLQELRVAQTGVQILLAFLLTIAFAPGFDKLGSSQQTFYCITVGIAAAAMAFLIGPVACHRLSFRRSRKELILAVSHRLTLVGLALLGLAVLGCVYLACWAAVGAGPAALWTAVAAVALGLNWVVLPLFIRMRSGPEDEHGSGAPSVTR